MGFWTIILAVTVGLAAFAILVVIYALMTPTPSKEQMAEVDKKLARNRSISGSKSATPQQPLPYIFLN